MMKILVINAGSSSLKYQLINMEDELCIAKGICERIGIDGKFEHKTASGYETKYDIEMKDHVAAFAEVKKALTEGEGKVLDDLSEVSAIGHRIVQGGAIFDHSVLVTPKVIEDIEGLAPLAPLHNHAHAQAITAAREAFGTEIPQVVVFDTAFHQTMPPKAYMFGIPYEYYEKYAVRRYGFHGTSHRYVSARAAELLGKPGGEGTRIITCHLGNGSSLAAIKDGKVIDTTMGLTPLDGFLMGTRCGAVDPSAITFVMQQEGFTPSEMDIVMNKKSGLLGISGLSSDDRDITKAVEEGHPRAKLAWDMRSYQIIKLVGGYISALGGLDAIVFTAGVGENQPIIRRDILESLSYLGMTINDEAILSRRTEIEISGKDSKIKAYVIPTNEELVIARDTKEIVEAL
ncbi:MAG: acetate kinase [Clostridia bacterium]|nr:acetate kinase [Clostridia bacterium]